MKKIFNLMIAFICVLCTTMFVGCDNAKCEHTASEDWVMNNTHHWHECIECNEKMDMAKHDWEEIVIENISSQKDLVLYVCKGCGMKEFDIFTVTEQEWNFALNLSSFDKVQVNAQGKDESGNVVEATITRIKDGDILLETIIEDSVETNEYFSKESDKYYSYTKSGNDWIKTEIEQVDYEEKLNLLNVTWRYSDFSYNKYTKAYEYNYEVNNTSALLQIYFKNGRFTQFKVTLSDGSSEIYTIEYDNVELELPIVD